MMSGTDVLVDAEAGLPTVGHRLMQHIGERRLMAPDDALAVWRVTNPRTADDAIGAIVASGGITPSQGMMLRDGFAGAQRAHLAGLLGAALQHGLLLEAHVAWAVAGFEAEILTSTPESYLVRNGVMTRGQLDAVQAENTGRLPPKQATSPELPASEHEPSLGSSAWYARALGYPPRVAAALFAVTALVGGAAAVGLWLGADFSFRHVRSLLGMSVTGALVLAPVFTHLLAAHLPGWRRFGFGVCAFAVANVGLGGFAVPLGFVGMRWLDGRPETRAKHMVVAALLGVGLLVLTEVVLAVFGASVPSWMLERAIYEGRGDQFVVLTILVLPKALLTGAAGLAAAWCVGGGQRFSTQQDVLRHFAAARWTWPMVGWSVGSAISGVLAAMTDERFTLMAYVATTAIATVAIAFQLSRMAQAPLTSPSTSEEASTTLGSEGLQGVPNGEVQRYVLERVRALGANHRVVLTLSMVATMVLLAVTCHWSADVVFTRTVKDAARLALFFCTAVGVLRAFAPTTTLIQSLRHGLVATVMLRHPVSLPGATLEWVLPAFITTGGLLLMRRNLGRRVQVPHLASAGVTTLALGVAMELTARLAGQFNSHVDLVRDLFTSPSSSFQVTDGVAVASLELNLVWFTSAFVAMWLVVDDGSVMPAPGEVVRRFLLSLWSIVPLAFGLGGVASFGRALVRDRLIDAEGMIAWGVLALLPVWWIARRQRGTTSRSLDQTPPQDAAAARPRGIHRVPVWILVLGLIVSSLGAVGLARTALRGASMLSTGEGLREVVMDGGGTLDEFVHVLGFGPSDAEIVALARDQIMLSNMFSGRDSNEAEMPSNRPPFEVQGARFGVSAETIDELGVSAFRVESFGLAGLAAMMVLALMFVGLLGVPQYVHSAPSSWRSAFEPFGAWVLLCLAFLWFGVGAGGPFPSGRLAWLGALMFLASAALASGGGRSARFGRARTAITIAAALASALIGLVFVGRGVNASPSSLPGAAPEPELAAQTAGQVDTPPPVPVRAPSAALRGAPSAPAAVQQPLQVAPLLADPSVPSDTSVLGAPGDPATLDIGEARLLRNHAVRLFSEHGGAPRPFRWTDINGQRGDLAVTGDSSRRLTVNVTSGTVVSPVAQYLCGPGPCTAFVNQREDGLLVVRFTTDASGSDPGSHLFTLHRQDGSRGPGATIEVARWTGTLAENTEGLAPAWAQVASATRVPISLVTLPPVACDIDEDCARLAMTLWLSLNHRYALAYALETLRINPRSTSALYTAASIHASVGDAARAAQYLSQLASVGTRDASEQLGRVRRDPDFDPVRADARITGVIQ